VSDVVAPGVRRIQLPLPIPALRIVNAYLVEGESGWSLVDSGLHTDEAERALLEGLANAGVAMRDVRSAFITHLHPDHMGMAGTLLRSSVDVLMHRPEIERARRVWSPLHELIDETYVFFSRHGMPADVDEGMRQAWIAMGRRVDDFEGLRPVDDGDSVDLAGRAERVRWTPGHTDHHAVLVDEHDRILFAGDHVLPHITPSIGVELNRPRSPLRDYLTSLQLIRALPDARLLPAHGPVTDSVHDRVDELLDHHEQRLTATAEAVGHGAHTAFEVARALTWTRRMRSFDDLDMFNQILAIFESIAHLRVLVERGWLTESTVDGIAHFV
jgi:glyoxylase-like metal-dependent hydrolase (beta-lactamase superfamily II)